MGVRKPDMKKNLEKLSEYDLRTCYDLDELKMIEDDLVDTRVDMKLSQFSFSNYRICGPASVLVPSGLKVYSNENYLAGITGIKELLENYLVFFATRGDSDLSPAYAVFINRDSGERDLSFIRGDLGESRAFLSDAPLDALWFSSEKSSEIFRKLRQSLKPLVFVGEDATSRKEPYKGSYGCPYIVGAASESLLI